MSALLLDSLEVRGFRAFRHLKINQLARVNLVVGKNNVGKSCLLEALRLYASRASYSVLLDLIESRDEGRRSPIREEGDAASAPETIRCLFNGRKQVLGTEGVSLGIGPLDSPDKGATVEVAWFTVNGEEEGRRDFRRVNPTENGPTDELVPMLVFQYGNEVRIIHRLDRELRRPLARPLELPPIRHAYIPANGLDARAVGRLWDSIALTAGEEDVLTALRIIAPGTERLNLVGENGHVQHRYPVVKTQNTEEPVPLRSLGEGMNRMFGIALALVNAQDGLLLIDEIESGLHYSVQPELWQLIFLVAERLNVQVVTTSHSWDCIEAFQNAAAEDPEEGVLIRLSRKGEDIIPTLFRKHELTIATRDRIEVR